MLPLLRRLRDVGATQKRHRNSGIRGVEKVTDGWKWPSGSGDYLFPSVRNPNIPKTKDLVSHAITRARKSFQPTIKDGLVHPETIRSHSGRHRMVNDLKNAGVSMEVGMAYARIRDKKTYSNYGRLVEDQVGAALEGNAVLKKTLKNLYGK